jgi:FkbM family methyltransferase
MTLTSLPFYRIFSNLIYIYPTPYGILFNSAIQLRAHMIGTYEYPASKILQKELKDARLFIDVGAHVGYYTLLASKIAKEVIALEPDPFNYKLLRINLRINGISNVYALNIAASNYTGTGIYASYIKNTGKLLTQKSNRDNNMSRIKIKVVKLDDLLLKIGKIPDVIKIDVEGSEIQVLEGLQETLRKGVKCLMIEVHSEENKIKAIYLLKKLGYKIISLKSPREEKRISFNEFLICKSKILY